ncbi:18304_t:CDS:1, partial [Funneliformis geosporum]
MQTLTEKKPHLNRLLPTPFCQAILEAQQSWFTQQKLAILTKLAKPLSRALAAIT